VILLCFLTKHRYNRYEIVRISKISIIKYWYFKWILFPVLYCNNILFLKTNINHKIFHRGHCREIGKSPLKGAENLHLGSHIASRIVLPFHIWATYRKTFQHSSIYLPQFCCLLVIIATIFVVVIYAVTFLSAFALIFSQPNSIMIITMIIIAIIIAIMITSNAVRERRAFC